MIKVEELSTEWTRLNKIADAELRAGWAAMQPILEDHAADQSELSRATAPILAFLEDPRVEYGYMVDGVVYASTDAIPREITRDFVVVPVGLSDVHVVVRRKSRPCGVCFGAGRRRVLSFRPFGWHINACAACHGTGREATS